jgi:hypothetical protein
MEMMNSEEEFTGRGGATRFREEKYFLEFHRSAIDGGGGL